MSRFTSPIDVDDVASEASGALSASSLPTVFGLMMAGQAASPAILITRDICQRPVPTYNDSYNPNQPEPTLRPFNYSPYANGQPLFDDRPVIVANLPQGKVLAPASKRTRTAWVWRIGYALIDNSHHKKPLFWVSSRYSIVQAQGPAQASGAVGNSYDMVIPFRQLEFKNAYLEWAINALPSSHTTVGYWINDMFAYFEPELIAEIAAAKSKISISFDGWGSKREKISVLGCVVHFVNNRNQNVIRLIGLPELPNHGKTGVEQCAVLLPLLTRFGINESNLGWFVLDNAPNNDTTLVELLICDAPGSTP
ncbi:hypothetical protein IFR05_016709 [Cadophora sp. M221]|nr:hypothetical protein IFR05_016709 [Cadophora sp. M221]